MVQPAQTLVGRRDELNACELLLERVSNGQAAAVEAARSCLGSLWRLSPVSEKRPSASS